MARVTQPWTKERLIAFEQQVKDTFLAGRIRAPIHLSGGNEGQLLQVFHHVRPGDWVFSGWRSHYHALLKGVPEEWVFAEILAGRSMALMNAEHRFLCSSIVGGILPIALGVAMGIKRSHDFLVTGSVKDDPQEWMRASKDISTQVWVFVGDMTARTGMFHEFRQYAQGHGLPVRIVVEDNGYSTDTPTAQAWGVPSEHLWEYHYVYQRTQPHVGVGQHVTF